MSEKTTGADRLAAILALNYYLTQTTDDVPFAVHYYEAPAIMIPLRGPNGLRSRLARAAFDQTGTTASHDALTRIVQMAEGYAISPKKERVKAWLRCGRRDGIAYLDLGRPDGLCAAIGPGQWSLTDRPRVLFRRGLGRELPLPAKPGQGTTDSIRRLINVADGGEWAVVVACRIAALLYPASTHPLELFTADTSGALKSTTTRVLKNWTDPGAPVSMPKDSRTWGTLASNSYLLVLDNVSGITNTMSDNLAKGTSGDSHTDRALYTDGETFSQPISIVPLVNGIGLVPMRADLAERTIRHQLRRPKAYLTDEEVERIWTAGHPSALGWLLDQAALVSAEHARGLPKPRTGRLADFEWVLSAVDACWSNGGAGMAWWKKAHRAAAQDTVAAHPVAMAIQETIKEPFTGTTGDLYGKINSAIYAVSGDVWSVPKVGLEMSRAVDALTKLGWRIDRSEPDRKNQRQWTIVPPAAQNGGEISPGIHQQYMSQQPW